MGNVGINYNTSEVSVLLEENVTVDCVLNTAAETRLNCKTVLLQEDAFC